MRTHNGIAEDAARAAIAKAAIVAHLLMKNHSTPTAKT
jgi:hypothetical protein